MLLSTSFTDSVRCACREKKEITAQQNECIAGWTGGSVGGEKRVAEVRR